MKPWLKELATNNQLLKRVGGLTFKLTNNIMIIKKTNFKLTPGFSAKDWPFNVAEIAILGMMIEQDKQKLQTFAVIHNWTGYALSGLLESYGFEKLETSGIWKQNMDIVFKDGVPVMDTGIEEYPRKSLSPFFKYLELKCSGK